MSQYSSRSEKRTPWRGLLRVLTALFGEQDREVELGALGTLVGQLLAAHAVAEVGGARAACEGSEQRCSQQQQDHF